MKSYVISIVAAAVVCAVTRSLLSEKTAAGQIARLLSGILMTLTVVAPLANITFDNLTGYLDGLSLAADGYVEDGKAAAQDSVAEIIKSQVEAYILDKADSMGLEIAVEVALDDGNDTVPCRVTITGTLSPYAKEVMSAYIEENIGVTKENQRWK